MRQSSLPRTRYAARVEHLDHLGEVGKRAREAERALAGGMLDRARAASAADVALKDARPLSHNAYKVAIARALVRRTVLSAGQVQDA